ncbi:MFS transporter [Halobellus litoreus]|uniref:MFS transporter n=1 Tax=Halobellus litoreus TaxID=755310 RepID=A0ABD6DUI3_9EURY|nr:MFS transporter [Halobellus litoreus]
MESRKRRVLAVIAAAELLAMSLWFSATAAAPELAGEWGLTAAETAWLTIAVQLGFVAGALVSSVLTLSDVVPPRYLFAGSAVGGAACTAAIAGFVDTAMPAIVLRFLTGVTLAGVYPPGMKILTGWFRDGRGFAIGVLVGALTVGSALPHLLRALGGVGSPRVVLYGAALLATVGGLLALLVEPGPYQAPTAPFDPGAIGRMLRDRGTMLANGGYFGHMWELYAVWTWIPAYLVASIAANGGSGASSGVASLLAFSAIAVGGVGAVSAGVAADRFGRTTVTIVSMGISGVACVAAGLLFGSSLYLLAPFVLIWGVAIVADSAQFSAAVSELAEESYVGTALTLQTAIGFLLTTISIQLIPVVVDAVGWRWAFAPLAIGPAIGTLSMLRLRGLPDASKLAGGRK